MSCDGILMDFAQYLLRTDHLGIYFLCYGMLQLQDTYDTSNNPGDKTTPIAA